MSEKASLKQNFAKKTSEDTAKEQSYSFIPQTALLRPSLNEYPELAPVIVKNSDKRNNSKFDYDVAAVEFLKGLVSPITKMFSSWGNFALGCSLITLGVAIPATLPIFVSIGLIYAGIKTLQFISKLIYATATKQNGDYVEQSFKDLGEATSSFGLSALGARSALGRAKLTSAEELTKLSLIGALAKNITSVPKTLNFSLQTLRSGEFLVNLKAAFDILKFKTGTKNSEDLDPPFSDISSTNPNPQGPNNIIMGLKPPREFGSLVHSNTLINSANYLRSANGLLLQQTNHLSKPTTTQVSAEQLLIFLANQLNIPSPQTFTALTPKPNFSSIALPLTVNFPDIKIIAKNIDINEDDLRKLIQIFIEELDLDLFNFEDQIIISGIREAIINNDQEKLKQILKDFGIDDSDLEKTQSQILENFNKEKQEIIELKAERKSSNFKDLDIKNSEGNYSLNKADSSLTPEQREELPKLLDEIAAKQVEGLKTDQGIKFAIFLLGVWDICKNPNQKIEIPSKLFPDQVYLVNPRYIKDAVAFDQDLQKMAVTAVSHLLRKNDLRSEEAAKIITEFYTTALPTYIKTENADFFRTHLNHTFSQEMIRKIKRLLQEKINPKLLVDNNSPEDSKATKTAVVSQNTGKEVAAENKSAKKKSSLDYASYQELAQSADTSEINETVVLYFSLGQSKEIIDSVKLLLKLLRDPDIKLETKQKILRDENLRIIVNNTIASREIPEYLLGIICGLFNLDSTVCINYEQLKTKQIKTLEKYRDKTREEFQKVISPKSIESIQQKIAAAAQTQDAATTENKTELMRPTKQQLRNEELAQLRQELALKGIEFSADSWKELTKFGNSVQNDIFKYLRKINPEQFNLILKGEIRTTGIHALAETAGKIYILHVTYNHRAKVNVKRDQGKIEIFSIQTKGEQEDDARKSPALKDL